MVEALAWVCVGLAGGIALEVVRTVGLFRVVASAQESFDEALKLQSDNRILSAELEHLRACPEPSLAPTTTTSVPQPNRETKEEHVPVKQSVDAMPWDHVAQMESTTSAAPPESMPDQVEKMPWDI